MILEARAENCFSSTFVLKVDGLPHGKFEGRWFSESIDVQCTGRQKLVFQKVGWLWSEFLLLDTTGRHQFGRAVRSGILTRTWDLELSIGAAQLVAAGVFATGYVVEQDSQVLGDVDRLGVCERGWFVQDQGGVLSAEDLILIGLVYHTILQRQQREASHAGFHGS